MVDRSETPLWSAYLTYPIASPRRVAVMREAVIPALRQAEIAIADLTTLPVGAASLLDGPLRAIAKADLVVADVTGPSANVAYEVGVATGVGKQVLLLTERLDQVTGHLLAAYPVVAYSSGPVDYGRVRDQVAQAIERLSAPSHPTPTEWVLLPPADRVVVEFPAVRPAQPTIGFLEDVAGTLSERAGEPLVLARLRTGSSVAFFVGLGTKIARAAGRLAEKFSGRKLRDAQTELAKEQAELTRAQTDETRRRTRREDAAAEMKLVSDALALAERHPTIERIQIAISDAAVIEIGGGLEPVIRSPTPQELGQPHSRRELPPPSHGEAQ